METIAHIIICTYITATCCAGVFFAALLLRSNITTPEHTIL